MWFAVNPLQIDIKIDIPIEIFVIILLRGHCLFIYKAKSIGTRMALSISIRGGYFYIHPPCRGCFLEDIVILRHFVTPLTA